MTEKIEVALTFKDFAEKNKSIIQLKQLDAKSYKDLLTVKAVKDQTQEMNFSENWNKELDSKIEELQPKAEKELKEASDNINKYLETLVESIFDFHKAVSPIPTKKEILEISKKIRGLIAAGGGQLDAEFVFNAVKVLYITKI